MTAAIEPNRLYYGDCLEVMQGWRDSQVDLIYLDPPFNSNQDYNILYGHDVALGRTAQRQAFSDTWFWDDSAEERFIRLRSLGLQHPLRELVAGLDCLIPKAGMFAYLTYMAERLYECHRLLKPSGNFYLHCDDTAVHYLRIVLDTIFKPSNYLNNIVWRRATAHNDAKKFGRICDHILFYAKDASHRYWDGDNPDAGRLKTDTDKARTYPYDDKDDRGRYRSADLTGPAHGPSPGGESAQPWKDYDVAGKSRVWSPPKTSEYAKWIDRNIISGYRSIVGVHDRLDALDAAGMIRHPETGIWPGLKRYAKADKGYIAPQSLILKPTGFTNYTKGKEWVGYNTQKPVGLIKPLIVAACPDQGFVLDPFAGCGSTVIAAHEAGRSWAGIDISIEALRVTLRQRFPGVGIPQTPVIGIPTDLESAKALARHDPIAFERWSAQNIPGMLPNDKNIADTGIDGVGEIYLNGKQIVSERLRPKASVLLQVSASAKPSLGKIRDFCHVVDREKAAAGVFITVNYTPTNAARQEVRQMGIFRISDAVTEYPRFQFWNMEDYFNGIFPDMPPLKNLHTGKLETLTLF